MLFCSQVEKRNHFSSYFYLSLHFVASSRQIKKKSIINPLYRQQQFKCDLNNDISVTHEWCHYNVKNISLKKEIYWPKYPCWTIFTLFGWRINIIKSVHTKFCNIWWRNFLHHRIYRWPDVQRRRPKEACLALILLQAHSIILVTFTRINLVFIETVL